MINLIKGYCASLIDPTFVPTGLRVAVIIGSLLFLINHGNALVHGKMTSDRWVSSILTYI
jgi:hypothetical protein